LKMLTESKLRRCAALVVGTIVAFAVILFHRRPSQGFPANQGGLLPSTLKNPSDILEYLIEQGLAKAIGNTLPLNLNANDAFPTVEETQLPGGEFHGDLLEPTDVNLLKPLPPGDYVVRTMAYCSEYSVHRPGQGTAYKLGPVEGTQAETISNVLWRGTVAGKPPGELQAISWAIQSGVTYDRMPGPYKADIDSLIPEYKSKLAGDWVDEAEQGYNSIARNPANAVRQSLGPAGQYIPLPNLQAPPLEQVLAKMGPPGRAMLDAQRQRKIFLANLRNEELREQVLFSGQGSRLPPVPATGGPWTVMIPNVAYVRFVVHGGNMREDNELQIRIVSRQAALANVRRSLILPIAEQVGGIFAPAAPQPSALNLMGVNTNAQTLDDSSAPSLNAKGVQGYSQGGQGAQTLFPTVKPTHKSCADAVKQLQNIKLAPGDPINGFIRNQTCIASASCSTNTISDKPWINSVISDFVSPFTTQSGQWKQVEAACRTHTILAPLRCEQAMANYHINQDLQNALDKDGCGTQADWDAIAQELNQCIAAGVNEDVPVLGFNQAANWEAAREVISMRNDVRSQCMQDRKAKGLSAP
jgi:hypothetical protein